MKNTLGSPALVGIALLVACTPSRSRQRPRAGTERGSASDSGSSEAGSASDSGASEAGSASDSGAPELRQRRALVIGVDGLRYDAFRTVETPEMDRLAQDGLSLQATTQLSGDTVSGPGWTSILTGVEVSRHRITGNGGWDGLDRQYKTFLWRARHELGLVTYAACHWMPILYSILEPDAAHEMTPGTDDFVTVAAATAVESGDHDVVFVHLDDVDHAGHVHGFDPQAEHYAQAIRDADARVGLLLDAVASRTDEDWLVIVVTDHGGEGNGHGPRNPANRTIPQLIGGPGVDPNDSESPASHMDVNPTVLRYLGMPLDALTGLDGHVYGLRDDVAWSDTP